MGSNAGFYIYSLKPWCCDATRFPGGYTTALILISHIISVLLKWTFAFANFHTAVPWCLVDVKLHTSKNVSAFTLRKLATIEDTNSVWHFCYMLYLQVMWAIWCLTLVKYKDCCPSNCLDSSFATDFRNMLLSHVFWGSLSVNEKHHTALTFLRRELTSASGLGFETASPPVPPQA